MTTNEDPLAAERARERQVFSYYPSSLDLADLRPLLDNHPAALPPEHHHPRPSNDAPLCAFAQLGAHRLKAARAFISLIDSQSQFVLAEATRSVPLGNLSIREAEEPLWLGSAIIPRAFGACQSVLHSDALVVGDLQLDPRFAGLPFAGQAPHFRFYAGVPLMTPKGSPIGVYCIIDDRPRHGLDHRELLFMQDVAATVVSYLSAARAHDINRKAEQMVRGLTSFVTGAADLQAGNDLDLPRIPASISPPRERDDTPPDMPQDSDDLLSPGTKRMFARAAHIMRESSDLDGVIFFDASIANSDDSAESPPLPSTEESDDEACHSPAISAGDLSGSTSSSYSTVSQSTCRILGFADAARSSRHGGVAKKDYLGLTEGSLRRLLKRNPKGKIFNIDMQPDSTPMKHTSKGRLRRSSAVEAIADVAHNARSAAIIPLWDYERQRWFAGCLCWTSNPNRQLTYGADLLYLRAFGNSIMAELGRIDSIAMNRSKTSFIESMSHELRSPLHGILGGVEYLLDMPLDAFQTSIINSIAMCGRTLLDTVQNVLEYSKINESTGPYAKSPTSGHSRSTRACLAPLDTNPPVNIRRLTEETVEAVFSGQSYNLLSPSSTIDDDIYFLSDATSLLSPGPRPPLRKPVRLILDLPTRPCWTFAVQPGTWRRILMNVFGNALRFTDAGFVRVSLSATDVNDSESRITLAVADSGCGMSSKYLRDGLYNAFSQENSFSSGTGLGMTIVQRLVHSIGGNMSVQSKLGGGTVVKIHMILPKCEEKIDDFAAAVAAQTHGMHVAVAQIIIPEDNEAHRLERETELQFHAALTDTLQSWFGIIVTDLDDVSADSSELIMYPGPSFNSMFKNRCRRGVSMVVAMDGLEAATLRGDSRVTSGWIDVVTQPCGPTKLARILDRYLSLLNSQSEAPIRPGIVASPQLDTAPYAPVVRMPPFRQRSPEQALDDPKSRETAAPAKVDIPELNLAPASDPIDAAPTTTTVNISSTDATSEIISSSSQVSSYPHRPAHPDRQREQRHAQKQKQQKKNKKNKSKKHEEEPRRVAAGKEILIVDDNALNVRLLSAFLNKAGFARHTSAANGLEALNLFKQNPARWGAVLMDLSMPIMDGVTATREIRAWERRIGAGAKRRRHAAATAADGGRKAVAWAEGGGRGVVETPPLTRKPRSGDSTETVREWREAVAEEEEGEESTEDETEEPCGHTPSTTPPLPDTPPTASEEEEEEELAGADDDDDAQDARTGAVLTPLSPLSVVRALVEGSKEQGEEDEEEEEGDEEEDDESSSSSSAGDDHGGGSGGRGGNGSRRGGGGGGGGGDRVEIIVITGLGSATARFEATSAGADVFMTKPIQFSALMKTLKGQLGRQDAGGVGGGGGRGTKR